MITLITILQYKLQQIDKMIEQGINQKFHSMGVLLILDCPQGLEFGIDNINWMIGNKFKGIKLIPLGTHIIAYSMKSQNYMFKISRFFIFDIENKIHVLRWNQQVQQFLEVRGEEGNGYKQGVKQYHFDSYLGPYPNQNLAFWCQTTKYITKKVLQKLDPIDKIQQFNQEYSQNKKKTQQQINMMNLCLQDQDGQEQIINQQNEEEQMGEQSDQKQTQNPGRFKVLSDTIYYTTIPRFLTFKPQAVTKVNMDKTDILIKILKEWKNQQDHLLGELQYSFVHFIIGQEQQSLNQWKKLIDLFISSESAYYSIQQPSKELNLQKLIMDFIPVFYDQLNQFPSDFFRDQLSKDNFIINLLRRLNDYFRGEQYSQKIKKRIQKLLLLVKNKFDFVVYNEEDNDEDLPVVVQQQQMYF